MLRFEHTEHLLLLLLLPVLLLLFRAVLRWKQKTVRKVGDESLVKQLISSFSPRRHVIRFAVVTVSLGCLIVAAANLQSIKPSAPAARQGLDIMIALDLSRSMLATDIKPDRLERAKQFIFKFVDRLDNNRLGIVFFAGSAYLQMPLSSDHSAVGLYVSNAGPDLIPVQGTVLGHALMACNKAFNDREKKYKAVVLISDGEDHDPDAIKAARQLAENGVAIFTIGAGTTGGATLLNPATGTPKRDIKGDIVVSRLNEKELTAIAAEANGIYQQLNDVDAAVDKLITQLSVMDQKPIVDSRYSNYQSFFQWFLALALSGLVADLFISERKKSQ